MHKHKKKFIWQPGEYRVCIRVETTSPESNIEKKCRFTLYESDVEMLEKIKDGYIKGDGVYWNSGKYSGVIIRINEG